MSDSLWPRGLQHARPSFPTLSPRVCSDSCPLSQWCHPTTSSSVVPFSCPQSFPASVFSNESALCVRWPKDWNFKRYILNVVWDLRAVRWSSMSEGMESRGSLMSWGATRSSYICCSIKVKAGANRGGTGKPLNGHVQSLFCDTGDWEISQEGGYWDGLVTCFPP